MYNRWCIAFKYSCGYIIFAIRMQIHYINMCMCVRVQHWYITHIHSTYTCNVYCKCYIKCTCSLKTYIDILPYRFPNARRNQYKLIGTYICRYMCSGCTYYVHTYNIYIPLTLKLFMKCYTKRIHNIILNIFKVHVLASYYVYS